MSLYSIWHLPETKGRNLQTDVEENLIDNKDESALQNGMSDFEMNNINKSKIEMMKL